MSLCRSSSELSTTNTGSTKILGKPWEPSVNTFKLPDLDNLQIRTTTYDTGKLIIRPGDPDGIYVLVIATPPRFRAAGWLAYSKGAKFPQEYWDAPSARGPECWAIPQDQLKDIHSLQKN